MYVCVHNTAYGHDPDDLRCTLYNTIHGEMDYPTNSIIYTFALAAHTHSHPHTHSHSNTAKGEMEVILLFSTHTHTHTRSLFSKHVWKCI